MYLNGPDSSSSSSSQPNPGGELAKESGSNLFRLALAALSLMFLLTGLGRSLFFIPSVLKNFAARKWPQVPCVVISSDVRREMSGGGRSADRPIYRVDILYEYEVGDRKYRSNQYNVMGGFSSGYSGKAAVVAQNPPGTRRFCYVNPSDPTEAVLDRSFGLEYIGAIVPAFFAAMGLLGLWFALKLRRSRLTA